MKKYLFLIGLLLCIFENNYAQVLILKECGNGKWGFVDKSGTFVIPCKYDDAWHFSEGLASVKTGGKWGFIDKSGTFVIPCKYDNARYFKEGLAPVKIGGKWGFIDKSDTLVISCKYDYADYFSEGFARVELGNKDGFIDKNDVWYNNKSEVFSLFAKNYVEPIINEWQIKGEFEKKENWQQRVNETTRNAKIAELIKEAEQKYIDLRSKSIKLDMTLELYDVENEVFLIKNIFGNLLVHVPIAEAPAFKANWNSIKNTPKYTIANDHLALAEVSFITPDNKTYTYSNQASLNYAVADINYNFDPINIEIADNSTSEKGKQTIITEKISVGKSDVDTDIPETGLHRPNTFAIIIGVENYDHSDNVPFARRDAGSFNQYVLKTLGIPKENIKYIDNADYGQIVTAITWIKGLKSLNRSAKVLFYYAGHIVCYPDVKNQEAPKERYLMPKDALMDTEHTLAYKLDDLYAVLGALPVQSTTVFLDACYAADKGARGTEIKVSKDIITGNLIVFTASDINQTALPYEQEKHGLFTYFLLKKIKETKGNVTYKDLFEDVKNKVEIQASNEIKEQSPSKSISQSLQNEWQNMKLTE
jgi:hypothetical protein